MRFTYSRHVEEEIEPKGIPVALLDSVLDDPQQVLQVLEEEMKVTYDPQVDVLRIIFSKAAVEESDEDKPGIIFDYDKDGNIVGMEILDASKCIENPRSVEYALAS